MVVAVGEGGFLLNVIKAVYTYQAGSLSKVSIKLLYRPFLQPSYDTGSPLLISCSFHPSVSCHHDPDKRFLHLLQWGGVSWRVEGG